MEKQTVINSYSKKFSFPANAEALVSNAGIDDFDAAERSVLMRQKDHSEINDNDNDDGDDLQQDAKPNSLDSTDSSANDKLMVDTDEGKRVRVPCDETYPGEVPYGAPLMGFNGKIASIFDAFAYMPNGQQAIDRPNNFLPIVGLIGDDETKNANPAWKLFGRLREDVYSKVKEELGDINASVSKAVVLVTHMRADNMALFSISQPHQMFAPSLWLATLPTSVMKVPMPTLEEPKIRALVLGERAKAAVEAMTAAQKLSQRGEQISMGF